MTTQTGTFREKAIAKFVKAQIAIHEKFVEQFSKELSLEYGVDVPDKITLVFESDGVTFKFLGETQTGITVKCYKCDEIRYGVCGSQYDLGRILGLPCDENCKEAWKKWDINDYPDAS